MAGLGLVLSGGGARGAYQAGALLALAELTQSKKHPHLFDYYTGLSAGAINTALLASTPTCHFAQGVEKLNSLWSSIHSEQVFDSDPLSLTATGLKWITDLSIGGMKSSTDSKSLLHTEPLKKLLTENCDFAQIQKNIDQKKLKAVAVSAMDYFSNNTVTFVQGEKDIPDWQRVRRVSEFVELSVEHILASSAIPLLFPPVQVGDRYFGDGCIRNQSPCGPAIYMGANKLVAIGVRMRQDKCAAPNSETKKLPPSVARIASVLLNAVMLDGLEMDIERLERINLNLEKLPSKAQSKFSVKTIDYLWIAPSRDFSKIAQQRAGELPRMIRYLLKGLGSLEESAEVASFLLFDSHYCKELAEIGYDDVYRDKENVQKFFEI